MQEKWSDEEHARFVEAIEKFGRDWGKIVAHIGTRTVAQVRFASLIGDGLFRVSIYRAWRQTLGQLSS